MMMACCTLVVRHRMFSSSIASKMVAQINKAQLVFNYYVSVYATKSGYEDSDVTTKTFIPVKAIKGDVDSDGEITISDAVGVVNIILNK